MNDFKPYTGLRRKLCSGRVLEINDHLHKWIYATLKIAPLAI